MQAIFCTHDRGRPEAAMTEISKLHQWPRERDLPESEREPFRKWMDGQTRPSIEDVPDEEQDAFYQHDYDRWKAGLQWID